MRSAGGGNWRLKEEGEDERGGALRQQIWGKASLRRRTEVPVEFKDLRGGPLRQQIWREVSLERRLARPRMFRCCAGFALFLVVASRMRMIFRPKGWIDRREAGRF